MEYKQGNTDMNISKRTAAYFGFTFWGYYFSAGMFCCKRFC